MNYDGVRVYDPKAAQRDLDDPRIKLRLKQKVVSIFADNMVTGNWLTIPQAPLLYDTQGCLRDGQHRLAAVVKAGVPVAFHVLRNLSEDEVQALDGPRLIKK